MPDTEPPAPPPAAGARTSLDWPADSGFTERVLGRLEEKVAAKNRRRRRVAAASAAVAAVLVFAGWAVPLLLQTGLETTAAAQSRSAILRDGSRAELNARTRLSTDFRYGRRRVRLEQGEALFTVAADAARPFVVETPRGAVRVTGTVFNVRLVADLHPEVTLLEGTVNFERGADAPLALAPGQQLSTEGAAPRVRALPAADLAHIAAWREGRLVLDGLTLAEAAERLAHYHGATIEVAPAVAHLLPGGTVPLANLAGVIEALQEVLPIRAERSSGAIRLVAR